MGHKGLLGCALHLSIASSLVLNPPQSLPEITNSSIALDASSNTSVIQLAPIPSINHGPRISNPASSLSLANITAPAENATLTQVVVSCNGAPFTSRTPVIYSSCQNAFTYTHSGGNVMTIGDRTSGDWDLNLPVRVMSDDGLCVFDFDVAESGQVDRSTLNALRLAAHQVLGVCGQHHNRGGEATGLGQDGRLTVTLKQYSPRVQCIPSDKPPIGSMCDYVVGDMPASKAQQIFGNRDTPDIDVPIPWTMATPGLQCVIKARMTAGLFSGPPIRTSFYRIWQQAVALTQICSHAGKGGVAYIYGGGEPRMTISIVNEARQSLTISAPDDTTQ